MLNALSPRLREVLTTLLRLLPEQASLFLVGGAVRDILRNQTIHDLDLSMTGEVLATARRLADEIGAAFYPLDAVRQTARIILQNQDGTREVVDIATLQGADLEADLRGRDFTINALAIDLRHPDQLLDPLGGARDLHAKILRACSPTALQDDPVRVVRAVRLAFAYQLKIDPETLKLIRQAAPLLLKVSVERKRDELFRILSAAEVASAIRTLDRLGVLDYLLPELADLKGVDQSPPHQYDVWEHTLAVVHQLSTLLDVLSPVYDPDRGGNLSFGMLALRLGRYRLQIHQHLSEPFTPDRTARPLLMLGALYHDIAKPLTQEVDQNGRIRFLEHDQLGAGIAGQRARALNLSTAEVGRVKKIVQYHLRPMLLAQGGTHPSRRAIYRFFRAAGKAGVDVCLLSLADFLGTYGPALPQEAWGRHLDVVRMLLDAWWEKSDSGITAPPVITGRQLIERFGLLPGPQIGQILEAIREAQVIGEVSSPEQAFDLAAKIIQGE